MMERNMGLGSWIARRARMTPDRTAIVFRGRRSTYRALDERVNRLARALADRGVARGDRVAFLGHNHPAALETLFACGLLGAIAVPLNARLGVEPLTAILGRAATRALVFTPELEPVVARLRALADPGLLVATERAPAYAREYEALLGAAEGAPLDLPVALGDTCLLSFTSGTTGRSKGVALSHGNVLFNTINLLSCVDYRQDDVMLASAPLYRMGGLGLLLPVFFKGATSVLQETADAEETLRLVEAHRATLLFDGPAALEAVRASARFEAADLSSIRLVLCGGAPVGADLAVAFARRGVPFEEGYGLTEASPFVLLAGRPALFSSARLVSRGGRDVPPGDVGELWVCGPNVMQGYWRDPKATARAVTADGWLRTGDAGRADGGGAITLVGRCEDALRLEGVLIHPGPLEQTLRARAGLAACAIVQPAGSTRVAVFVVARRGGTVDPDAVLAVCREHLPARVRIEVRQVPDLPRNANGKLLRHLLRATATTPGGRGRRRSSAPPKVVARARRRDAAPIRRR
jgi:fatty-acyl-CoA synthase